MHITKALKKPIFVMIMLIFSLSIMTTAWAAQPDADDLQGHWAETRLRSWSDQGLLQGYNGKFNPDRPVTRAELVTLINRSLKYPNQAASRLRTWKLLIGLMTKSPEP